MIYLSQLYSYTSLITNKYIHPAKALLNYFILRY